MKYLKEASLDLNENFFPPARIYKGIDRISIPRKSIIRLENDVIRNAPTSAKIISEYCSAT
jgi:hypothetical protein